MPRVCEYTPSIDIRKLKAQGCLQHDTTSEYRWKDRTHDIHVNLGNDRPCINFKEGGRDHTYYLGTTTPYYGGKRWRFWCRDCHERCAVIYRCPIYKRYYCRQCAGLYYEKQLFSKLDRAFYKIFGGYDDIMFKQFCSIKYPYRNGKPTRKRKRYMKLEHMSMNLYREDKLILKNLCTKVS